MLGVLSKLLGILGIVLLVLLCVILALLLLVLFYPVSYRVSGEKNAEEQWLCVRLSWLLGLLRGRYDYPTPGKLVIKLLCFTLYDSSVKEKETAPQKESSSNSDFQENSSKKEASQGHEAAFQKGGSQKEPSQDEPSQKEPSIGSTETSSAEDHGFFRAKLDKIKYTILKIYDKIKYIWENIAFYRDLWRDEQTRLLIRHAGFRLSRIWHNIRPKRLRAELVIGTGEPDTTGYLLAIHGMLSPFLGDGVRVTGDFEQRILQGEFYIAGYLTIFQLVFHSLMVVFDRRLSLLRSRLKKHKEQQA